MGDAGLLSPWYSHHSASSVEGGGCSIRPQPLGFGAACHHRLLLCVHVADRRPVQHRGARQVSRPCCLPPSLAPLRSCCRPPPRATSWCSPSLATLPPATIACSFAFMLPTAAPCNIVVLAKSRDLAVPLRVRDFFFTGLPITCLMLVLGTGLLHVLGPLVFDVNAPFPKWACDEVSCLWMNVSGAVNGMQVFSQACTFDVTTNVTDCRLASGTWIPMH